MKIVINNCFGGFAVSQFVKDKLGVEYPERTDPKLIELVEKYPDKVNTSYSSLKVIEIPDGIDYTIEDYDGAEWIAEKHRTWGATY